MNASEQSLYDRICQFSFDDGDEHLAFAHRLARENGWTQTYAASVIDEYKRFIFLAVVAGHPVTPSDQVDQVWHLHLTYTKSYWDELCGQILGSPLHHGPTRGGAVEAHKFDGWYRNTLDSYTRFFGHQPPTNIWPDPSVRFGKDLHFQRVNTKQHWVIRRPRIIGPPKKVLWGLLLIFVLAALALTIQPLLNGGDHGWATADHQANAILLAEGKPWWILVLVVFVLVAILSHLFGNGCPACNKRQALEKTGAKEEGGLFKAGRVEWKCKYCGHREWKKKNRVAGVDQMAGAVDVADAAVANGYHYAS